MKKRMIIMLISVTILFGLVFGYKWGMKILIGHYVQRYINPVATVSATKVNYSTWRQELKASGSVRAVQGVNVTTQMGGMVKEIYFQPGAMAQKGDLLVQLNIDPDTAQLHVLEANAKLAEINYKRDKAQYKIQAVSKATLDTDEANLKSSLSQVEQQKATIEQKTIRAPFTGRLGISKINLGQYLNPGDTVTMLQTLDPIYVDFYVPQQYLDRLVLKQKATVMVEPFPNRHFVGAITTIDPALDSSIRNIQVETTLLNRDYALVPGMFATISLMAGEPKDYLTLPQSAISFNPYGEIVYIILEKGKGKEGKPLFKAYQRFVKTGEKRGDQIQILSGLKQGDWIVTSGQMKLKNGREVEINNSIQPLNDPDPKPMDE